MPNLKGYIQVYGADLSADEATASQALGTMGIDDRGNTYMYVKAAAALAYGKILMRAASVTATSGLSTDTAKLVVTKSSWGLTAGAYSGYLVYVYDGGAEGDIRVIKYNDATTLTVESAFSTAFNATSKINIFHPAVVDVATGSSQIVPVGICQATGGITSGQYGWMQVGGVAPCLIGTGAATLNLAVKVGNSTAGEGSVIANGDDLFDVNVVGYCLVANTNADKAVPIRLAIR